MPARYSHRITSHHIASHRMAELEQYHKSNAALDLMIGELRLKMDGMQREINEQRESLGQVATYA